MGASNSQGAGSEDETGQTGQTVDDDPPDSDEDWKDGFSCGRAVLSEDDKPKRYAEIPLMWGGGNILIDDNDASVVLLFPDPSHSKFADQDAEIIEQPFQQARKIFERRINERSSETLETGFELLQSGQPVTRREYRKVIWEKFLWVMESSGFRLKTSQTCDQDEIIMKIRLDRNGDVIKQLAARFQYRVPFKSQAYQKQKPLGNFYAGGAAPLNEEGEPTPAFAEFKPELVNGMEKFTELDEIRLIMKQLREWVKIEELVAQGIIIDIFPAANYEQMVELNAHWSNPRRCLSIPGFDHFNEVREYFGERVAFFFEWTTFFVQWLGLLAIFGAFGLLGKLPFFPIYVQRYCRFVFFLVIAFWAAIFNQKFKNRMARSAQQWGCEDFINVLTRPDWNPDLENSWFIFFLNILIKCGIFAYLGCFIFAVGLVAKYRKHCLENGLEDYSALIMAVLIKVGGWLYARTAAVWVTLQNHDNQAKWDEAIAVNLSLIKLFISLFPFVDLAFLQSYTNPTCANTLNEAAVLVYHGTWPENTPGNQDLSWLDTSAFRYDFGEQVCIYGCYPEKCAVEFGRLVCTTNCVGMLEESLMSTFLVVVGSTIALIIAPIFLVRWEAYKELKSMELNPKNEYSLLQVQAKCHQIAPYLYYSWGGSHVEDFTDYVILFAIMVCFGMMLPAICVVGFFTTMIQYRLFAYRMVNVTCRPFPHPSSGIGVWQDIIERVCQAAIVINVALVCFVMPPIRDWDQRNRLVAFIFLEHIFLILQVFVGVFLPAEPEDVDLIDQINSAFKARMMPKEEMEQKRGLYYSGDLTIDLPLHDQKDQKT